MSREFIFGKMQGIRGYLDPSDALSFSAILQHQARKGYKGAGAEIGVFFGRSYFLMRRMMGDTEPVFAADLFNIGERPDGGSSQMDSLIATGQKLGMPVDPKLVHKGDSGKLTGEDIRAAVGPVRFFSVDGGHFLEHVRNDAVIARDSLSEEGVIAFDDVFNFLWPEVVEGVLEFLQQNPDFKPFALTGKKVYVCRSEFHDDYFEMFLNSGEMGGIQLSKGRFHDTRVVLAHNPTKKRILYELMVSAKLSRVAGALYPGQG